MLLRPLLLISSADAAVAFAVVVAITTLYNKYHLVVCQLILNLEILHET